MLTLVPDVVSAGSASEEVLRLSAYLDAVLCRNGRFFAANRSFAAWSRRNRRPVRAGSRMTQKRADFIGRSGRENVLELASLLFDFGLVVHGKAIREQALGQTMAADDTACFVASALGQRNHRTSIAIENSLRPHRIMARIDEWLVIMRLGRMRRRGYKSERGHLLDSNGDRQSTVGIHACHFRAFSMLFHDPQFFQNLVELLFVCHGEDFLRCDLAMMQLDAAVRQPRDDG